MDGAESDLDDGGFGQESQGSSHTLDGRSRAREAFLGCEACSARCSPRTGQPNTGAAHISERVYGGFEIVRQRRYGVDSFRRTVFQGKGKKGLLDAGGGAALASIDTYMHEARPQLVAGVDAGELFLGAQMLESGADIRCIQQVLGHENLQTTELGRHVSIGRLRKVQEATHPAPRPAPWDRDVVGEDAARRRGRRERGAEESAALPSSLYEVYTSYPRTT